MGRFCLEFTTKGHLKNKVINTVMPKTLYTCHKAEKFWKESFTEYATCLPTEVTSFSKNTDSSTEQSTCTFLCQLPIPFLDKFSTITNYIT